jgi:hypothetical protein
MAGMGMDMGIGQGAALAGSVMSSIGDQQSFKALAKAKRRQRAEQMAFQDKDNADQSARITNDNQWLMDERNAAQAAQAGQKYLEATRGMSPVGLSVSQRVQSAPQTEMNQAELQAANQRLAQATGEQNTQTGLRLSAGEFADRRGQRMADAERAAALYDIEDMQAAGAGDGLRAAGGLLQVAGGAAGSGMLSGGGGSAPAAKKQNWSPTGKQRGNGYMGAIGDQSVRNSPSGRQQGGGWMGGMFGN